MPECSDNCGCKVKIERNETDLKCVKDEVGWMKKLLIGNLVTAIVVLVIVVVNLLVRLAESPPG